MGSAHPDIVTQAFATSSNHRVDLVIYSDARMKTRKSTAGLVVAVLVNDAGGTTRSYTATHDDDTVGELHIDLTGSNHVTAGDAEVQVHIDTILKKQFTWTFVTKMTV